MVVEFSCNKDMSGSFVLNVLKKSQKSQTKIFKSLLEKGDIIRSESHFSLALGQNEMDWFDNLTREGNAVHAESQQCEERGPLCDFHCCLCWPRTNHQCGWRRHPREKTSCHHCHGGSCTSCRSCCQSHHSVIKCLK